MGVFYINQGNAYKQYKNILSYSAHDVIYNKFLKDDDTAIDWRIHLGAIYQEYWESPNAPNGSISYDRRLVISDIHTEGGLPELAADNYAPQEITWSITKERLSVVIDTNWHGWESRVLWESAGNWKPDNWDSCKPYESFETSGYNPWKNSCAPYQTIRDFPYCTPIIFEGWWKDYFGPCLPPPCNQTPCISHNAQWGYPECLTCPELGLMGLSAFPVNIVYITMQQESEVKLFAAAIFNGPLWYRRSGIISVRYRGRIK